MKMMKMVEGYIARMCVQAYRQAKDDIANGCYDEDRYEKQIIQVVRDKGVK